MQKHSDKASLSSIFSRAIRLCRIAWLTRRIHKAEQQHSKQAAQHALAELLASSRGLPMKVGQFLAGMDDTSSYAKLTTSIEPLALTQIKPILEKAWQQPLQLMLQDIQESQAAASLGQVHRAHLNAHDAVAIKVQYPHIATAIEAEMKIAGLLPAGGPIKTWDFNLETYKQTLHASLNDELDYLHEMKQQLAFASTMHVEGLCVPHVFPMLCRHNVLVQEWIEGVRLSATTTWPLTARLYIARTLMQTMFQSLFEFGLVHGDPHPGNMLFQYHDREPQTTLLDFGCMVHIEKERRMALLKLILHSRNEAAIAPLDAFVALGFDTKKLAFIEDKLPQLIQLLFQPFIQDSPFDSTQWHLSDAVETLLGDQRWWFRSACPADLFLLVRIFQGLSSQLETLNIQLPWWSMLEQAISQQCMDEAILWQVGRQVAQQDITCKGSAKELHIHIIPPDKSPIRITLPANQALQLADIVPQHIHQHIQDAGIDLQTMRHRLIHEGLEPQSLIDIRNDDYHYHLYLT